MTKAGLPGKGRMMLRGLTRACPVCGKRRLFRGISMIERCPRCNLRFERIEGHWVGAIGINTIVTFGLLAVTLVGGLIATFPDFPVGRLIGLGVTVAILVPILFHPSSRMLWTAIDIAMRPLEPHEVDWSVIETDRSDPEAATSDNSERDVND